MKRHITHLESFSAVVPTEQIGEVCAFIAGIIRENDYVSLHSNPNGVMSLFINTYSAEVADAFEGRYGHLEDFKYDPAD
jgi:hypothetical protein